MGSPRDNLAEIGDRLSDFIRTRKLFKKYGVNNVFDLKNEIEKQKIMSHPNWKNEQKKIKRELTMGQYLQAEAKRKHDLAEDKVESDLKQQRYKEQFETIMAEDMVENYQLDEKLKDDQRLLDQMGVDSERSRFFDEESAHKTQTQIDQEDADAKLRMKEFYGPIADKYAPLLGMKKDALVGIFEGSEDSVSETLFRLFQIDQLMESTKTNRNPTLEKARHYKARAEDIVSLQDEAVTFFQAAMQQGIDMKQLNKLGIRGNLDGDDDEEMQLALNSLPPLLIRLTDAQLLAEIERIIGTKPETKKGREYLIEALKLLREAKRKGKQKTADWVIEQGGTPASLGEGATTPGTKREPDGLISIDPTDDIGGDDEELPYMRWLEKDKTPNKEKMGKTPPNEFFDKITTNKLPPISPENVKPQPKGGTEILDKLKKKVREEEARQEKKRLEDHIKKLEELKGMVKKEEAKLEEMERAYRKLTPPNRRRHDRPTVEMKKQLAKIKKQREIIAGLKKSIQNENKASYNYHMMVGGRR